MKKYLNCIITTKSGQVVNNPLKLSEVSLISKIAQENKSVFVELREMDLRTYKITFG